MNYNDWLVEYRKDKKRSDSEFYPLNSEIFEGGQQSRQAEVDQLKEAMERQGKLAIQAMHEAHKGSRLELSIAKDIQASLKPELIESERQMNAQLTEENMKLEAEIEEKDKRIEELESALKKINENLDLHDCESCWEHWFEIEKVLPEALRGDS